MILDVVTPEGAKIKALDVRELTVPGVLGEMGVLPAHEAFATALTVGVMTIVTETGPVAYALAGGFIEVLGDHVRILTETCERGDEIDRERAKAKLDEATQRLQQFAPADGEKYRVALDSVRKAETRLLVARPANA